MTPADHERLCRPGFETLVSRLQLTAYHHLPAVFTHDRDLFSTGLGVGLFFDLQETHAGRTRLEECPDSREQISP